MTNSPPQGFCLSIRFQGNVGADNSLDAPDKGLDAPDKGLDAPDKGLGAPDNSLDAADNDSEAVVMASGVSSAGLRQVFGSESASDGERLKLRDCGARRGSCRGGTKMEATDVRQRHDRTRRPRT